MFRTFACAIVRCVERHRLALFLAAIVAATICFSVFSAATWEEYLIQSATLAITTLLAVGLGHPQAMDLRRVRYRVARPSPTTVHLGGWIGYVLAVGLAAGALAAVPAFTSTIPAHDFAISVVTIGQIILLCLFVGVFEEGVFRVLALDAFAPLLGGRVHGLLRAAVVSAVLFGMLHVTVGEASSVGGVVAGAQVVFKPIQAALLGFFMAALWARTGNLWTLVVVHGAFNVVYTGPSLVLAGVQTTYITGDPTDLVLLVGTVALLVPPAIAAYRSLREE